MSKQDDNTKATVIAIDALARDLFNSEKRVHDQLDKISQLFDKAGDLEQSDWQRLRSPMLQLRLDNEDIVKVLLRCYKSFSQAIGLDPLANETQHLERLAKLLGEESLRDELSLLGHLIDELEKIHDNQLRQRKAKEQKRSAMKKLLDRLKNLFGKDKSFLNLSKHIEHDLDIEAEKARTIDYRESRYQHKLTNQLAHEMHTAIELQSAFRHSLLQLTEAFQEYGSIPKFGVIYDYLAGLKGSISRFHLAYQNGLGLINALSQRMSQALGLQHQDSLTNQKQLLLNRMHHVQQLQQQSTLSLSNQQQRINELTAKVAQAANQPHLQQQPTVKPVSEQALSREVELRRTFRNF